MLRRFTPPFAGFGGIKDGPASGADSEKTCSQLENASRWSCALSLAPPGFRSGLPSFCSAVCAGMGMLRVVFLSSSLLVAACASEPSPPSDAASVGPSRTLQDINGSQIATPVGLFLTSLDGDRDTALSTEEMAAGLNAAFAAGDGDQNGALSAIEFEAWSERFLGARHTTPTRLQFDRDQDTSISQDEFRRTFDAIQQRLDRNGNGELQRAELLVTIDGAGVNPDAMRQQMEAEMRRKMQEMCRRGRGR